MGGEFSVLSGPFGVRLDTSLRIIFASIESTLPSQESLELTGMLIITTFSVGHSVYDTYTKTTKLGIAQKCTEVEDAVIVNSTTRIIPMSTKRARTGEAFEHASIPRSGRAFKLYRPRGFGYAAYGASYMPRGTAYGLRKRGATYASATPAQRAYRKRTGWVGRGSYSSAYRVASRIGKTSIGRLARRVAIGAIDAETGGMGSLAVTSARQFGRGMYTGRGMYKDTSANILVAGGAGSVAGFASASDETGALTISHSEYVQDIYGLEAGENFHLTALRLNPGLHSTFPWLSQIAANYEEYELIQLLFTFESKISDQMSGSNGQVGSIIMFTDYGPDSPLKTSKYTMLQGYASGDALLTNNLVHGVECDPRKLHGDGHKYIRTRAMEGSLNDYDLGILQLGVSGTPTTLQNQIVGQLHVSYTVKLMKPRIYSALALAVDQDVWSSNGTHTGGHMIFATPLMPGVDNGIGTLLEITQAGSTSDSVQTDGTTQKVKLTFPASFSGAVEIVITTLARSTGADNDIDPNIPTLRTLPVSAATGLSGNIKPIKDIMIGFGGPSGTPSIEHNFYQGASGKEGRIFRCHYDVEMADSGVDNSITFSLYQISTQVGGDGPIDRSMLEVRRYNSRESDKAPLFIDANGLPKVI